MLGLLNYVVDAVGQLDDVDVSIVPTSIVYDQLQEVGAIAAEDAGGSRNPRRRLAAALCQGAAQLPRRRASPFRHTDLAAGGAGRSG